MSQMETNPEARSSEPRGATLRLPAESWKGIGIALRLSPRELEVVRSVFEYGADPLIAVRLGISPHTVHTHLDRIYRKLDLGSRCDLVLRVFETYIALEKAKEMIELRPQGVL